MLWDNQIMDNNLSTINNLTISSHSTIILINNSVNPNNITNNIINNLSSIKVKEIKAFKAKEIKAFKVKEIKATNNLVDSNSHKEVLGISRQNLNINNLINLLNSNLLCRLKVFIRIARNQMRKIHSISYDYLLYSF